MATNMKISDQIRNWAFRIQNIKNPSSFNVGENVNVAEKIYDEMIKYANDIDEHERNYKMMWESTLNGKIGITKIIDANLNNSEYREAIGLSG